MVCNLCLRKCNKERGENTFCKAPEYALVSKVMLHKWEEPCISGENGSGCIFFSGCNLRCVYCQNIEISKNLKGIETDANGLIEIYKDLEANNAHNINLVTGAIYADTIIKSLEYKPIIPVVYNSSGYEDVKIIKALKNKADVFLPDFKYSDNALGEKYSNVLNYFEAAKAAVEAMYEIIGDYEIKNGIMTKGVLIRHLVLPDNLENTYGFLDWFSEFGKNKRVKLSLMSQYTPNGNLDNYPEINRGLKKEEYDKAVNYALLLGIKDMYTQQLDSCGREYIPDFD